MRLRTFFSHDGPAGDWTHDREANRMEALAAGSSAGDVSPGRCRHTMEAFELGGSAGDVIPATAAASVVT